jgi:hypothetical protein
MARIKKVACKSNMPTKMPRHRQDARDELLDTLVSRPKVKTTKQRRKDKSGKNKFYKLYYILINIYSNSSRANQAVY